MTREQYATIWLHVKDCFKFGVNSLVGRSLRMLLLAFQDKPGTPRTTQLFANWMSDPARSTQGIWIARGFPSGTAYLAAAGSEDWPSSTSI
jgi:hypothetical protein